MRGDGTSPEGYDPIAEINSITGPGMTRDFIDVTSLDSVGGYREYIGGFRDGGEVTLEMNFTSAGYAAMLTDFESADSRNYQIVISDPLDTTLTFAAFVTDLPLTIVPDDKITLSVTLKITGAVDMTT